MFPPAVCTSTGTEIAYPLSSTTKMMGSRAVGCGVQCLPELTLAGGAIAQRNVGDFVAVEFDVFELPVVARGFFGGVRMRGQVAADFGAANSVQNLRPGGRGAGDDIEVGMAPVGRHLPAAGTGIVSGAYCLQQHVIGGRAQGQAERPVAIIGKKPVVARLQGKSRSHSDRFVPGARDLEEYLLLALEQDLAIVHPPRSIHMAVGFDQLIAGKAFVGLAGFLDVAFRYCGCFRVGLCSRHPVPLRCECDDAGVRCES